MYHIAVDARVINSGTGDYVKHLLNGLQKVDKINKYSVIVPSKDIGYWSPSQPNFTVIAADFDNYSFNEQIGFKKFLEDLSPDLVHFCMPQQPIFYRGKRVTTMHDMTLFKTYNSDKNWLIFHFKQLIGRYVWKRVGKISDRIIAITETTKKEFQELVDVPDEKISVIYEASTATKGAVVEYTDLPQKDFILYVGQQPDYKNIRRLGEAHQKLLASHPDLGLVLVGRLNPDTLANKAYFESKGYKNIHFTGFLPDEQRDWLFQKAKAYIFPSLMEGFGLPPLIAMDYGTPVVSSNASCMPEVLGDAAVYFDPLDTDDMANSIDKVLTDNKLQDKLVELGNAQVARYSWAKTAEQTHAIYMDVLKNSSER